MDFIISLAHFCEICGPTSTICTQITPANCTTCHPCVTPPSDDPPPLSHSYSNKWSDASSPEKFHDRMSGFTTPFETPPLSPRSPNSNNPYFPSLSADNKPMRQFCEALENDVEGCDNCQFMVPDRIRARLPEGAPGSPSKDGRGRNGSPVLRSSESITARLSSESDDGDSASEHEHSKSYASNSSSSSSVPSTSASSPLGLPRSTHTHTLMYHSTRQPISPTGYSLLRRSIIRTLSCETLPKSSRSGPLYFGDPSSGYTIAYVFRLPDPRARGRLRTYALIALGGKDSWRVSMAMVKIQQEFENIANQIIAMADRVLERESPPMSSRPPTAIQNPASPVSSSSATSLPARTGASSDAGNGITRIPPMQAAPALALNARTITPVSSFLSAKKVDPDGYPRMSREVMRAKSLSEIVGKPDFFVDLHARFVMILSGLVKEFGAGF